MNMAFKEVAVKLVDFSVKRNHNDNSRIAYLMYKSRQSSNSQSRKEFESGIKLSEP